MSAPVIAVSTGCPSSIGPEVSVVAAARETSVRSLLIGDLETLRAAAKLRGVPVKRLVLISRVSEMHELGSRDIAVWANSQQLARPARPGEPDREAGAAQLAYVDEALRLTRDGLAGAMTTAPVSKYAIATSGARGAKGFLGHTEHLAKLLGAEEVVMAFWSDRLVTSLVTTHVSLARVPKAIRADGVARATYWLARLVRDLGQKRPRLAVAALNPHAGEGGLLGDEETRLITPGIEIARARLARSRVFADVAGPLGAETAFRRALSGDFDAVVAMYHDQATIPMKCVSFGDAVNVTLGLPIVRTSVDHGTAYDIAGKGLADASAMRAALVLAGRLSRKSKRP